MSQSMPTYALPLLRTWLVALKPDSCLCCDAIGRVDQKVSIKHGTTMCVTISCGQLSVTWMFDAVDTAHRSTVATAVKKLTGFAFTGGKHTADMTFALLMRQAVMHTEPLGVTLSAVNPGVVLNVDQNAVAQRKWNLKPHTRIVKVNGNDVRGLSSPELATALTQHPRPHSVETVPSKPVQWVINSADPAAPNVVLMVHPRDENTVHPDELYRALYEMLPASGGEFGTRDGKKLPRTDDAWTKAKLYFHHNGLPDVRCGSC